MGESIKSIRLYGKPNKQKLAALRELQEKYTEGINTFVSLLWDEKSLWKDIFLGKSTSSEMRIFERMHRIKSLGSALSQTAMDEAVEKLSETFSAARSEMIGFYPQDDICSLFVRSKALFCCMLSGGTKADAEICLEELINSKKTPPNSKEFYRSCLDKIRTAAPSEVDDAMNSVRTCFLETKKCFNTPCFHHSWVRADSRVQSFCESKDIAAPYVLQITTAIRSGRTAIPLTTSPDSLRRMKQYKLAKSICYNVRNDGSLVVSIAVKKNVSPSGSGYVGADAGITDVIAASDGKAYGTLSLVQKLYDDTVLPHLKRLQALRNLMRKTRRKLHSTTNEKEKSKLRTKICHINTMLQQNKVVRRSLNRYDSAVDKEIAKVVREFVADRQADGKITVLEKLDIREFKRGRKANRRDSMWSRGKLSKRLKEALEWHGLLSEEVEPAYTSQICPICGHLEKANRSQKSFKCLHCGHEDDADHNAAINIMERAANERLKSMLSRPMSLRQKQKAIREWYAEKEAEYDKNNCILGVS